MELRQVSTMLAEGRRPLLYGEAGVGKTALARALASPMGAPVAEAGALATLSWLPYLPFRRLLGRQPTGDAAHAAAEVEDAVAGCLLLLDDVHWADAESRAVAARLGGGVTVVATVRRGDRGAAAALEELGAAGFELVPLDPLGEGDAQNLVRRLRPGLARASIDSLVRRSGGNPLLLGELAVSGEPTESLRLAVAARLRALSPSGIDAMALLALAGRPLGDAEVGGADELVDAGLAVRSADGVAVRHALLGDAAVALLDDATRRTLHERLAHTVGDAGEAARHFAAAGLRAEARAAAERAAAVATTPGERAAHLGVAAACADGADADELKLRAAAGLVESGRYTPALELLETLQSETPLVRAEARLLEYLAATALHRADRARAAWADAERLSTGTGSDIEVRVRIESADVAATLDGDHAEGLRRAEQAYRLARQRAAHLDRARVRLGSMRLWEGKPGWERLLRAAIDGALAEGDYVTVSDAVASLVYGLLITGQAAAGRRIATRMAATAAELELLGMERFLRSWLCGFLWHTGSPAQAVEEAMDIVAAVGTSAEGRLAEFYLAQSLIEVARFDEGRRIVEARVLAFPDDPVYWLRADLELLSGRPREADAIAAEGLEKLPAEGPAIFVRLSQCWARLELEQDPGPPRLAPHHRMAEAAPLEERAVRELHRGRGRDAAALLDQAAALWRGRHARGELRCLWGAGEAARRGGDLAGARTRLALAERRALECGSAAMLTRVHRSLRLAGVRRAAPRGSGVRGLTPREREILGLVADGLTNLEIARRLGIGRPTVARIVSAAASKLGARSRLQAASLASLDA